MVWRHPGCSAGRIGRTTSGPVSAGPAAPGSRPPSTASGPRAALLGAAQFPGRRAAGNRMKPRRASRSTSTRHELTANWPLGRAHRNRRQTSRVIASRLSPGRPSMTR